MKRQEAHLILSIVRNFLLFCIDFSKHKAMFPDAQIDWAEVTLIGAVDAGIMAQKRIACRRIAWLGGVYIGALRNNAQKSVGRIEPAGLLRAFGGALPRLSRPRPAVQTAPAEGNGVRRKRLPKPECRCG